MNRLRKIAKWIWLNKERMVLAVMVGFLCYRVYQVVFPPVAPPQPIPRLPGGNLDESRPRPGAPLPPPPRPQPDVWQQLWVRNPFYYEPFRGTQTGGTDVNAPQIDVTIERFVESAPGVWRVQLKSGPSKRYYGVGDSFQTYTVQAIDAENGTVDIFAENLARTVQIKLEQ